MSEKGIINGKVIKDNTIRVESLKTDTYTTDVDNPKALVNMETLKKLLSELKNK